MREADVGLAAIPQVDGQQKMRPVLLLRRFHRGDYLVAGISTQLHVEEPGFDDLILPEDSDYPQSGLTHAC